MSGRVKRPRPCPAQFYGPVSRRVDAPGRLTGPAPLFYNRKAGLKESASRMPVGKESKLLLLVDAVKEWLPTVRVRFGEWWAACRGEPILFWHTPAIRYSAFALGGLLAIWAVLGVVGMFTPAGKTGVPRATTADFHVICTDPACGAQFVIKKPFGFHKFPVECPRCKKTTGERALRCVSATCKGKWVTPRLVDGAYRCPDCQAVLGRPD